MYMHRYYSIKSIKAFDHEIQKVICSTFTINKYNYNSLQIRTVLANLKLN
ncbi:hypothetical protein Hanom_Chr09g00760831 [Helianthus anomalus]